MTWCTTFESISLLMHETSIEAESAEVPSV